MDLQEKLIELSEYGVSFNVASGNFVIKIKYNSNWTIIQPDGNEIAFYRDENDDSVYYYVASVTTSIDKIFFAIDETIEYNRELELKVELFKEKMSELQEIFAQEPLDVLRTLEFKLKKKKKKKEKTKKEKVVKEKEDDINNIEEVSENEPAVDKNEETEEQEETLSEIDVKINEVLKK